MRTGIIYYAKNISNGKMYIGQTSGTFERRKKKHLSNALSRNLDNKFYMAIRKYGEDGFSWGILEENMPLGRLDDRETYWISFYKTLNDGYNMTLGGPTVRGYRHTKKTKEKIGKAMKGRSMMDHYIASFGEELGKKKYEEYIRKLNKANGKGKNKLALFIERHGNKEGTEMYNRLVETCKNTWQDKKLSDKHKQNISKGMKGKKMPESQKEKLRNRVFTDEHRRKISEARKRYWDNKKKGKT